MSILDIDDDLDRENDPSTLSAIILFLEIVSWFLAIRLDVERVNGGNHSCWRLVGWLVGKSSIIAPTNRIFFVCFLQVWFSPLNSRSLQRKNYNFYEMIKDWLIGKYVISKLMQDWVIDWLIDSKKYYSVAVGVCVCVLMCVCKIFRAAISCRHRSTKCWSKLNSRKVCSGWNGVSICYCGN